MGKFLWFVLATMTSQALKYYIITYTPCEGLHITSLPVHHMKV